MADDPYRPHEGLVTPARTHPQVWRLVAGLAVATSVAIVSSRAMQGLLQAVWPGLSETAAGPGQGNSPESLLVLLFSFGFVILGVMTAARLVHHRDPWSLIGPIPLAFRQFWHVARILFLISAIVLMLPPYDMGVQLHRNLEPSLWVVLLPLSLLAVLIQTSAEEILFRGYIQQTLAARFKSPLIWMGAPALIFALGHYLPGEAGENAWLIALWSGIFGLVTADLTARSGTLGPAVAVHMFNNITALLIIALPDSLSGLALYTVPFTMSDTGALREWLAVDFATMMVSWLAARVVIRR